MRHASPATICSTSSNLVGVLIKTSADKHPRTSVVLTNVFVFVSLPFKAQTNSEFGLLRGRENCHHSSDHLPSILIEGRKKIGLCQLLLRNLPLVTLDQKVLLSLLSRIGSPEAVRSFRCVKFVKSSAERSGPSR